MADEQAPEDNAAAEGDENLDDGSKKKKIIIIVALVVVLLGGGIGAFLFLSGGEETKSEAGDEAQSAETTGEEGEGGKTEGDAAAEEGGESTTEEGGGEGGGIVKIAEPEKISFGNTYKLKPFHLNLGNPLENRQIMIEIALQYRGDTDQEEDITSREAQLRDAVISIVSRKTRDFLLGPDGKDQLRLEILTRLNQYLDQPIEQVYITDIMIE